MAVIAVFLSQAISLAGRARVGVVTRAFSLSCAGCVSQHVLEASGGIIDSEDATWPEGTSIAPPTVESTWPGDGDSDAESVDSDLDDPLKHAGSYSAEEVIRMMRDKLIRLQKLYIDQFQRLQWLLKEHKRRYRQAVKREKDEHLMSVHRQPKETPSELAAYNQLKALSHYNRPQGSEHLLLAQQTEKRIRVSEGDANKTSSATKCTYKLTTNTVCGETCLPFTKLCMKHIMEDEKQVRRRSL